MLNSCRQCYLQFLLMLPYINKLNHTLHLLSFAALALFLEMKKRFKAVRNYSPFAATMKSKSPSK